MTGGEQHMTRDRTGLCLGAAAAVLALALFHVHGITGAGYSATTATSSLFVWVARRWLLVDTTYGNDFPFGWVAPLVSLWMVWRLRRELRAEAEGASWTGFAVMLLALLAAWVAARAQQPFATAAAFIALAWAIPFHLHGWRVARRLLLPVAFLAFAVPLYPLAGAVLRLRVVAASASAFLLSGLGLPAELADPTTIRCAGTPDVVIAVAQYAGGLRSLTLALAAAVLLAWLRQRGFIRQALLVLAAPAVVLAAGVVRTVVQAFGETSGLLHWPPDRDFAGAAGSGLVFYAVAGLLLAQAHRLIRRIGRPRAPRDEGGEPS